MTVAHPAVVNEFARAGFQSVTADIQHGFCDYAALVSCANVAAARGLSMTVRVPFDDYSMASRALDAGASAIIMPMVNSADDASRLVNATKYPPAGERSWGPHTALPISGLERDDFLRRANEFSLSFAMMESADALEHIERIIATPHLDGIFIGPFDLSVSLSRGREANPSHPAVDAAIEKVLLLCLKHQKIPAIFAASSEQAAEHAKRGFQFICIGTDMSMLRGAAEQILARAKG